MSDIGMFIKESFSVPLFIVALYIAFSFREQALLKIAPYAALLGFCLKAFLIYVNPVFWAFVKSPLFAGGGSKIAESVLLSCIGSGIVTVFFVCILRIFIKRKKT